MNTLFITFKWKIHHFETRVVEIGQSQSEEQVKNTCRRNINGNTHQPDEEAYEGPREVQEVLDWMPGTSGGKLSEK